MRTVVVILLSSLASVGAADQPASSRDTKPVLRIVRDAAAGETIAFEDIAQQEIPADLVTSSYFTPEQAKYVIGQKLSLPVLAGDFLQWSLFDTAEDAAPWEGCRKAADEPDTAQAQVARAQQIVLSMKRAGAPAR